MLPLNKPRPFRHAYFCVRNLYKLKRWQTPTRLLGDANQKTTLDILTAVRAQVSDTVIHSKLWFLFQQLIVMKLPAF